MDIIVEVQEEDSLGIVDKITEALNEAGIRAYVYKKDETD